MEVEKTISAYGSLVYRVAYSYTKNFADAQDIAQEVFITLAQKKPVFPSPVQERAWLMRCTKNRSLNWMRSPSFRHEPLPQDIPAPQASIGDGDVLPAVLDLPEKLRITVYLYYYEDLDIKQTAKCLGISASAVKTRLCRARELLRTRLKGDYDYEI